jgi:hypothetical protein
MISLNELIAHFAAKDAEVSYFQPDALLIVDAHDTLIDDNDIGLLRGFDCLKYLNLSGTSVTNSSIPFIAEFLHLELLDLGSTNCDEECLEFLMKLRELRSLDLSGMRLTKHFEKLLRFPNLVTLGLNNTNLPVQCVRALIELTNIERIELSGTGFQPSDFLDLSHEEEDWRLVHLDFGDEVREAIERPKKLS